MASKQGIEKILYLLVNAYSWFELPDKDGAVFAWGMVLDEFEDETVEQAVKRWMKESPKEPCPADIRAQCLKLRPAQKQLEWQPNITSPERLSKEETMNILKKAGLGKYAQ